MPHPEKDLRLNLMVLGSDIIAILNQKHFRDSYVLIENVLGDFLKKDSRRTPDLFIYSLVFLYSVGLIEKKEYKIKLVQLKQPHFQISLL